MRRFVFGFFSGLISVGSLQAQYLGQQSFAFLNAYSSARQTALGGSTVSVPDKDAALVAENPSLLHTEMHNALVLSYYNFVNDINLGNFMYARRTGNSGAWAAGIKFAHYGKFDGADETGIATGTFDASEYAIYCSYSQPLLDHFIGGVTLKPILSTLENYTSVALAADAGISYLSPEGLFSASVVMRNAGTQLVRYYDGAPREALPFNIQFGISQKLQYAPFRFLITADNLQKFDLRYDVPREKGSGSPTDKPSESGLEEVADMLMRHLIFGVEFVPAKNFFVRGGYNYRRRKEMVEDSRSGMTGFSWGFGFRVSKFHLSYGSTAYHLGGTSNYFTVTTNLGAFGKAKTVDM